MPLPTYTTRYFSFSFVTPIINGQDMGHALMPILQVRFHLVWMCSLLLIIYTWVSKQQFIYELTVLGSLNNLIAMCPCSSDIIKHVIIRCLVIEVMKHHEVLEILFCPYCKITRNQASRDFNYRWPARDFNYSLYTGSHVLCVCVCVCVCLFIFLFFYDEKPHQGRALLDPPLDSKPQIHDPTHQNCVSGNSREAFSGDWT
jgi:hypothetical protein